MAAASNVNTRRLLLDLSPHCQMSLSNQEFFLVATGCSVSKLFAQPVTSRLVLAQIEHEDPYFSATWLSK